MFIHTEDEANENAEENSAPVQDQNHEDAWLPYVDTEPLDRFMAALDI